MAKKISLMDLYNTGAHRGNKKSRVNPKLKSYIHHMSQQSTAVIDLAQTVEKLDSIAEFFYKLGSRKKQIMVVGTSHYIKEYTPQLAGLFHGSPSPYVNSRWLGGTITNWATVKKTLKSLEKLENIIANKEFFDSLSRNEQLQLTRECAKKKHLFDGLKHIKNTHLGAVVVLDGQRNYTAILEAEKKHIPVIVFGNTNTKVLPQKNDHMVVFNNTSIEAVSLIGELLVAAYNEGLSNAVVAAQKDEKKEKVNV